MLMHDLPFDEILIARNYDKPIAEFYVDDRGVGYKGDWKAVADEIRERS